MSKWIPYLLIFPVALVIMATNGNGQEPVATETGPVFRSKVSFADIEEYDRLYPQISPRGKRIKNSFDRPAPIPIDPADIIYQSPKLENVGEYVAKDSSPAPEIDFQGLDDNGNSIPPDVNGAVGPDHLMVTLNTQIRIMDRTGTPISTVVTETFWQGIPGAGGVFDPKIYFDPYDQRWILAMPSASQPYPINTKLMVAVSETADPTGNWFRYSFDGDPNDLLWFDYPNFGFNKKWLVVAGNMVQSVPEHAVLYVFNKQDLYNFAYEINYSRFEIFDGFGLVPAVTMDEEEEDVYVVNHAGGDVGGYGYLNLRRVTGEVNDPQLEDIGLSGVPYPWNEWSYFDNGDFAPQLGSDEKLNTVDARFENMVFRNNKLWCVHHVYLPAEDPTRSAVQWWELSTDGTIVQWGREDGEEEGMVYAFASIAVNAKEDVMIGYGSFSEDQYASASYSFRYADDPPNTLLGRYQYKDGLAPYYKTFGGARNRWGDYTATCVDPLNDLDFWTIQEYAEVPSGAQDEWGVWWAKVNVEAMPEALFSANITSVPVGSGVNFFDNSKYEPDAWEWIFEGGTPGTSNEQNPENIIYEASGLYDVTLIAGNAHGNDTLIIEEFIDANTTVLPEVDFIASDTIPCVGDVVILEDLTVYNPVSWLWEFTPDDVAFVNGTDATSQHPEVIFEQALAYEVKLTATNNNGNASLAKTGYVKSGGVQMPFAEDFEDFSFAKRGWIIDNPDEQMTWEITAVEGNDPGGLAAYVNIKNYNGLDERDRLISPPLNFAYYDNVSLNFDYAYSQRYSQFSDTLVVYISADCGNTWERIMTLGEDGSGNFATAGPMMTNFFPTGPEDWCGGADDPDCIEHDLSEWAGQTNVRLMFETVNRFGNNIFIDNIMLTAMVGEDKHEADKAELTVFPNPTTGLVYLRTSGEGNNLNLVMYDISGRIVLSEKYAGQAGKIIALDLSEFNQGIYFMELREGPHTSIKKVVKK